MSQVHEVLGAITANNMISYLINFMIVLTPFLIIPGMGVRLPKEIIGFALALSIVLFALYEGKIKAYKNKWVLVFIGCMYISIVFAPHFKEYVLAHIVNRKVDLLMNRVIYDGWMFKAFSYFLVYTLMMIVVASVKFTKKEINRFVFLMVACGAFMAAYVLLQKGGLDQFFQIASTKFNPDIPEYDVPEIGGFLGQSTIVAPYIAMIVPLALHLKRYVWAAVMVFAVALTVSKVAIVALIIGIISYFILSKKILVRIAGYVCIGATILAVNYLVIGDNFNINTAAKTLVSESNGRVGAWKGIWKDFTTKYEGKKRVFTGFGPGSFAFSHSIRKENKWWQAHCDPFEVLYNFGILGFYVGIITIGRFLRDVIPIRSQLALALSISLFTLILTSFGTFSFQIAPNLAYAVIIIGLLQNKSLGGIYEEKMERSAGR